MNDSITVRGFVATDIKSSTTPGGVATASFRMGSTERRYDRTANAWVDGHVNWFTVQGYRQLAGNMGCSIKKGQRIIVVGRLKLRSWETDGRVHHAVDIDAESVGHDLMWGSANYTRNVGHNPAAAQDAAGPERNDGGPDPDDPYRDFSAAGEAESGDSADDEPDFDAETGELKETAA
ncbi:single-stranded DNA-binding protein [Arthrobacter sp. Soil763]|uniref:single-stranded DNA-binding protein n=1 Tax=Arthrobacter sp. Soil763 TaxID=1736402 RepID=UPI0006FEF207|nr:single-stranded DNA-binding protein [Arthrobacter sp. Soil763]KRE80189.1 single-stranded DNA-binding protein [Arthrobacter sp. Soil763]